MKGTNRVVYFIDSKVPQEMQVQKAKAHILSVVVKASSVLYVRSSGPEDSQIG